MEDFFLVVVVTLTVVPVVLGRTNDRLTGVVYVATGTTFLVKGSLHVDIVVVTTTFMTTNAAVDIVTIEGVTVVGNIGLSTTYTGGSV